MRRVLLGGVLLLALAGCSGGEEHSTEMPIGVSDPALVDHVSFSDVAVGDCIADTRAVDGLVSVAECDVDGAVPIQAVTTVGQEAPASRPADQVVYGYAAAACAESAQAYAEEHSVPETGLLQISVISDSDSDWVGGETPVVCAVSEAL